MVNKDEYNSQISASDGSRVALTQHLLSYLLFLALFSNFLIIYIFGFLRYIRAYI